MFYYFIILAEPFIIKWLDVYVMMFISITYSTPLLLKFYRFLKSWTFGGDIGKLIISQFLFFPMFNAGFIAYRYFLLGNRDVFDIYSQVSRVLPLAQKTSWSFWIPQSYIAIKYIPHDFHILFGSLCAFFWNIIFALLLNTHH